ncbi:TVP38/TMEM64 family protein [Vagococcus teuberi]|uniref:TVP38/TMEM64 family membrane protein n=1 Tax=Vagococcus teuberi TaxID=519472 RepID=A0A1J0A6U1_9ENTE|nr:VTT domain-containing protein [Vagococcus teuberi]APB31631.1 hypothetical protein BHY08_07200 [Vagococcus teuberi]
MKKLIKVFFVIGIILLLLIIWYAYNHQLCQNPTQLKQFIHRFGWYAPVVFTMIQIIQPILPIIPGGMSDVVGVVVFGKIIGVLYASVGLIIGEVILFILVRHYGRSFVLSILSEKNLPRLDKLIQLGNKHTIWMLIIVFLMPFGPDDLACLAAGFTNISFKDYLRTIILFKPLSVAIHCYLLLDVFKMVKIN